MSEDCALELFERLARLEAELVDQRSPRTLVHGERVRLSSRAVEREHQLRAEPLPERLLRDQLLELADELAVSAEREIGVDPVFERRESKLVEADDLRLRERLPGEIGERGPAPQRERRPQAVGSGSGVTGRKRSPALLAEPNELEEVDALRLDHEPITRRRCLERAFGQQLSQLRDVDLDRVPSRFGGFLSPERVDQPVARHDVVRVEEQDREQGASLLPPERDRCSVARDREGAEETELLTDRRHHSFPRGS